MKRLVKVLLLAGLLSTFCPSAFAESPPEDTNQMTQQLHPELEILAETVWVNVKNRQAVTKVFLAVKNPGHNLLATGFHFPLTEKDTLVDFGVSRRSGLAVSSTTDSAPPLAASGNLPEANDSVSVDSFIPGFQLAPGETATVLLVYQTALGDNQSRYVFPLKDSFKTKGGIRSFAFYADLEEKTRIMEVKTENYPIVVRGNGPKRQIYFYQNYLRPKADIGFSYRAAPKTPETGP